MKFPRSRFASDGITNSFQINPTTDTVMVRGIIANKKDQASVTMI